MTITRLDNFDPDEDKVSVSQAAKLTGITPDTIRKNMRRDNFNPDVNNVEPVELPDAPQPEAEIYTHEQLNVEAVMKKLSIRDDIGTMFRDMKAAKLKEMKNELATYPEEHLIELQKFITELLSDD